jgi:hypothetical protein
MWFEDVIESQLCYVSSDFTLSASHRKEILKFIAPFFKAG